MNVLNQDFFLVRTIGSHSYEMGSGFYSVPKLYGRGPANGLVTKRNKEADRTDAYYEKQADELRMDREKITKAARYEAVPVTLVIGEAA